MKVKVRKNDKIYCDFEQINDNVVFINDLTLCCPCAVEGEE